MVSAGKVVALGLISFSTIALANPAADWEDITVVAKAEAAAASTCPGVTEYVSVTTSVYGIQPEPTTVYQTFITTAYVTVVETLILTASEELIPYTTTEAVTSLTLCPTRVANPTFTAPGPYPTDWTWGCPPNWLCRPARINCNFEAGLPDRYYYCAPNECIPAEALTQPLPTWDTTIYGNSTPITDPALKINAVDSYFNMAPPDFGLTYEIFVVDEVITSYSTVVIQPTGGLAARQAQTSVPGACYPWCNNCLLEAQSVGKTPSICQPGSAFEVSLNQCEQCISIHKSDSSGEFVQIAPQFQQFLDYCASQSPTSTITAAVGVTTPTPVKYTTVSVTSQAPVAAASTSATVEVVQTVHPTVVTLASAVVGQTTLAGTALASATIVIPLGGTSVTTLYGSQLSNATIFFPGAASATTYPTLITTLQIVGTVAAPNTTVAVSTLTVNSTSTTRVVVSTAQIFSTTTGSSSSSPTSSGSSPSAPSSSASNSIHFQPPNALKWLTALFFLFFSWI